MIRPILFSDEKNRQYGGTQFPGYLDRTVRCTRGKSQKRDNNTFVPDILVYQNSKDLAFFERNLEKTRRQLDSGAFFYELDTQFHHRLAEIAGNRLILFVIDSLKNAVVNIKLQLELDERFSVNVYESHLRILETLKRRDPDAARREMHDHIQEVEHELVDCCDADSPFDP